MCQDSGSCGSIPGLLDGPWPWILQSNVRRAQGMVSLRMDLGLAHSVHGLALNGQ